MRTYDIYINGNLISSVKGEQYSIGENGTIVIFCKREAVAFVPAAALIIVQPE